MAPAPVPGWLLFADIDGTLWCGRERPETVRRRLDRAMVVARVVLASSRTIEEILELQRWTGRPTDLLAENGARLATRDERLARELGGCVPTAGPTGLLFVKELAAPVAEWLPLVREAARAHRLTRRLAAALGWPGEEPSPPARPAPARRASLLLPRRTLRSGAHAGFLAALQAAGLDVVDGGEWTSISQGASKGRAARCYADAARRISPRPLRTAAIGNSANDASLLAAAERPFVVRDPARPARALADVPGAGLLSRTGCAGWYEALNRLAEA